MTPLDLLCLTPTLVLIFLLYASQRRCRSLEREIALMRGRAKWLAHEKARVLHHVIRASREISELKARGL